MACGPGSVQKVVVRWAQLHHEAAVPWFEPSSNKTQDIEVVCDKVSEYDSDQELDRAKTT